MTSEAKFFEVSAEWLKACGYGEEAKVFPVTRVEHFGGFNPAFATMYHVTRENGYPWIVAACRGRVVDSMPSESVKETRHEFPMWSTRGDIRIEVDYIDPGKPFYDAFDADGKGIAIIYKKHNGNFEVMPYDSGEFITGSLAEAGERLSDMVCAEREAMAALDSLPPAGQVDMCSLGVAHKIDTAIRAMGFQTFDYDSGGVVYIAVSAEHGDSAADYYGEYRGGYPWINPKLEKLAERVGCYWEWINPGAIMLCV